MNIEREEFIKLLVMSYNKGFKDAGAVILELSNQPVFDEQVKDKLRDILPK